MSSRVERVGFNADSSSLARSRESMATSASGVFEEEKKAPAGVIKQGTMQGGFTPFKGKGKSMYVVLSERAIEIYENEKAYQKKKPSKYTIDLAIAFNVHNDHFDPKLTKCVCVMRPDDTLLLKAESEQMNQEWFEAILATAVPARALHLGRFATPQEFFEAAYDVVIVDTPKKLAQRKGEEPPVANIVERHPHLQGARRLCFYAHTIFLCLKNIEPGKEEDLNTAGIPPFKSIHAFEIQRKFIPNFGYRDNYFILMMGRGSPMGSCEMWAECESKHHAEHLHHLLNDIIEREADKKRRLTNGTPQQPPSVPSMSTHDRGHRQRSHTQPHRQRLASEIMAGGGGGGRATLSVSSPGGSEAARERRSQLRESKALVESFEEEQRQQQRGSITVHLPKGATLLDTGRRNTNSPLANLARKPSTGTVACTAGSHRTPPTKLGAPSTSRAHSFAASSDVKARLLPHSSVFPARRQSETIKEEATAYQPMDPRDEAKKKELEQLMRGEMKGCRAVSPSTTRSSTDETEDSGGTLRCFGETEDSGGTLKMGVDSRPHTPPNGSIRNLSLTAQTPRPYIPIKSKADNLSSSEDERDADVISEGTNTSTGGESISTGDTDYAHMDHMDHVAWQQESTSLNVPLEYKLNPSRAFVSSSDSCYSSQHQMEQQNGPPTPATPQEQSQFRTYSFGPGHPSYQRPKDVMPPDEIATLSYEGVPSGPQAAANSDAAAAAAAKEDARKRAFSLGSKNFFASFSRPFRKVSSRARASATSTSGVSLSSTVSSGGAPPSSSSSNHIATLGNPAVGGVDREDYRNRSGSFGSGRSTPYSRRSGPAVESNDHLMELDFGGGPTSHHGLGRCGSGSMGSVDSPSRSRTSSFGCNLKRGMDEFESENGGMTPSQILLAKAKQQSVDENAQEPPSDYVLTEAPQASSMTSPRPTSLATGGAGHHHHHHHHHQHSSPDHAVAPPPAVQHNYSGLVSDVMGKSHDSRSSQFFETIEESNSGRSSRASSIDDSSTAKEETDAEYSEMHFGAAPAAATGDAAEKQKTAAAAPVKLQPTDDSKQGSRSRSASPAASSTRRGDSSSTLQSVASSSDRSDRENKETTGAADAADPKGLQQLPPTQQQPRQKISTHSEGPQPQPTVPCLGLPKRSSVPVLKDQAREEGQGDAAAVGPATLNYALLQMNGGAASPQHDPSRGRSKSGIIFSPSAAAAAAAAATGEYAVVKPICP